MTQTALVTGAGRGIGAATAKHLASMGFRVGVIDLDETACHETVTDIVTAGGDALAVRCDVGQSAEVSGAVRAVSDWAGEPSVLVNNAGIGGPFHRLDEVSDDEWDTIMQTNLKSVFLFCRALLPAMKQAGYGRIVNIASIQGLFGAATSSTYVASKHGVIGYTRAIAAEWGEWGITCNAICPGYVQTRMGVQSDAVDQHLERVLRRTPAKRVATPEEIASMVAHLVDPNAGYINGSILVMDGGITADVGI